MGGGGGGGGGGGHRVTSKMTHFGDLVVDRDFEASRRRDGAERAYPRRRPLEARRGHAKETARKGGQRRESTARPKIWSGTAIRTKIGVFIHVETNSYYFNNEYLRKYWYSYQLLHQGGKKRTGAQNAFDTFNMSYVGVSMYREFDMSMFHCIENSIYRKFRYDIRHP